MQVHLFLANPCQQKSQLDERIRDKVCPAGDCTTKIAFVPENKDETHDCTDSNNTNCCHYDVVDDGDTRTELVVAEGAGNWAINCYNGMVMTKLTRLLDDEEAAGAFGGE